MREGSVGGVGSVGRNPKKYKGILKIGFGKYLDKINYTKVIGNEAKRNDATARVWDC